MDVFSWRSRWDYRFAPPLDGSRSKLLRAIGTWPRSAAPKFHDQQRSCCRKVSLRIATAAILTQIHPKGSLGSGQETIP